VLSFTVVSVSLTKSENIDVTDDCIYRDRTRIRTKPSDASQCSGRERILAYTKTP